MYSWRSSASVFTLCATLLAACFDGNQGVIPSDGAAPADARKGDDVTTAGGVDATTRPTGDAESPTDRAATADGSSTVDDGGAQSDASRPDGAVGDGGAAPCASRETCGNGLDDDCDGRADNGCACVPGAMSPCYEGPIEAAGRGQCVRGTMRCEGTGEFGTWSRCAGSVAPAEERCDGVDNDCDGLVDEGFCRVDGVCARDGEGNPASPCQVCVAPAGAPGAMSWTARPAETVCRPAAGPCDTAERCEGSRCPDDVFAASSTVCRAAEGDCDVAESCTGTSSACPADVRHMSDRLCRASAGDCDVAERCDGTSAACPTDGFQSATRVCRASRSVEGCDPAERCTGSEPACPSDVMSRAPATEICDGVDNDCDGAVDEMLSRGCYPGPAGTEGRGICRGGTQTCAMGAWGTCAGAVVPATEVCRNGADEDCDGMVDEGCTPCIMGSASASPWQMHRSMGPVCFGRTFSTHGDPGQYAYASVPAATDGAWRAVSSATIDFAESSALCGRTCSCLNGGEFTYFQTFFDVTPGFAVTSLSVTMNGVDDGARVSIYNSMYPAGAVDAGSYILLGGTSVSTNLARFVAPGRNRVVITHVDDCCSDRSITGVRVVINGAPLATCP